MLLVSKNRPSGAPAFSAAAAFTCLAALGLLACSASDDPAGAGGTGSASAGSGNSSAGSKPVTGGGAPAVGVAGQATAFGGGGGGSGGALPSGASGAPQGGSAPQGGASPGGGAGAAQAGAAHVRDHCLEGYDPDPTDATMKADGPVEFSQSNQIDLTVQPEVLEWFKARVWEQAHFQWHNIRRCTSGAATNDKQGGGVNPCKTNPELIPTNQENKGPGDGLEFLAMHRHMIQSLKQLWPKHTEQFEGWEHFPTKAADVPKQWQADWSNWMANVSTAGGKADDPASHMSETGFESEGAFGQWIQSTSGLHGALHFKWVRPNNSVHGLGNQFTNIDNYMFWKMHGWIDKVWDRYRTAKGLKPTDADIKAAVLAQCRQMDQLAIIVQPSLGDTTCTTPPPAQTGVFVDTIRPIFESSTNKCTGCHGPSGAEASLTLGGSPCVKSSDIVASLVGKPAIGGGQFKLIEAGNADKSWLYLKVTGKAATAGCTATTGTCSTETMPRGGGVTLTQAQQDALKKWINDGAVAPK